MASPRVLRAANVVDYGFRYADTVQRHALGMFIDKEVNGVPTGDRFRYVFVGTGGLQSEFGCCFGYKVLGYHAAPVQATGAGSIGDRQVTVTIADGDEPASGLFVANSPYLIGGRIVMGHQASQPQTRIIVGNTATTISGGAMLVTLDEPLDKAVVYGTSGIEIMMNRYSLVTSADVTKSHYITMIGMPAITCAAGVYAWVQTRGIVWITSNGATCDSAGERSIWWNLADGSVRSLSDKGTNDQLAGYAVDMSGDASSNSPFVMLQGE